MESSALPSTPVKPVTCSTICQHKQYLMVTGRVDSGHLSVAGLMSASGQKRKVGSQRSKRQCVRCFGLLGVSFRIYYSLNRCCNSDCSYRNSENQSPLQTADYPSI